MSRGPFERDALSSPGVALRSADPRDFRGAAEMPTSFTVKDMTIHRIVEQEYGFTPLFEFLPTLTKERFEENRAWMEEGAYDAKTGNCVLCFQSYVVKTPHQNTPLDNISESVLPVIEANKAELVTSDHELNDHIRLTPTPGHTPDHFAVCAGRGGDQAVFTGDLMHSPIQARYPELVMRVDTDRDQAVATRRRFFERYCDTDTLCCTMHFPSPSVGHIKRWGDGFRLEYVRD